MNKGELIKAMAEKTGFSQKDAAAAYDAFVCAVTESLKAGEKVGVGVIVPRPCVKLLFYDKAGAVFLSQCVDHRFDIHCFFTLFCFLCHHDRILAHKLFNCFRKIKIRLHIFTERNTVIGCIDNGHGIFTVIRQSHRT